MRLLAWGLVVAALLATPHASAAPGCTKIFVSCDPPSGGGVPLPDPGGVPEPPDPQPEGAEGPEGMQGAPSDPPPDARAKVSQEGHKPQADVGQARRDAEATVEAATANATEEAAPIGEDGPPPTAPPEDAPEDPKTGIEDRTRVIGTPEVGRIAWNTHARPEPIREGPTGLCAADADPTSAERGPPGGHPQAPHEGEFRATLPGEKPGPHACATPEAESARPETLATTVPASSTSWMGPLLTAGLLVGASTLVAWRGLVLLYTILTREKILRHETRRRLLEAVRQHPGASLADLARMLDLARSVLLHHARRLEQAGFLVARSIDRRTCLFAAPAAPDAATELVALRHRAPYARLLERLSQEPGQDQLGLAQALNVSQQRISQLLARLARANLLRFESTQGRKRYTLAASGPTLAGRGETDSA